MKAIILAAGQGERLRPLTNDRPKCMVELCGKTLLEYQLESLDAAGIHERTIVTGYREDQIKAAGCGRRHNPRYAETNMVASLMSARDLLDGSSDLLIAYADIVYDPQILKSLAACKTPLAISVDLNWQKLWELRFDDVLADAESLKLDSSGQVVELGQKPKSIDEIEGQYMGLIKVRADVAPRLVDAYDSLGDDFLIDGKTRSCMYMTSFLQFLIDEGIPIRAVPVNSGWLEVDCIGDLTTYHRLADQGRLQKFWRPLPNQRGAAA